MSTMTRAECQFLLVTMSKRRREPRQERRETQDTAERGLEGRSLRCGASSWAACRRLQTQPVYQHRVVLSVYTTDSSHRCKAEDSREWNAAHLERRGV